MEKYEIIKELESLIRQTNDAMQANKAGTATFKKEYEILCTDKNEINRERMDELYTYMVYWTRDVRRLEKEIKVFQSAIDLINTFII